MLLRPQAQAWGQFNAFPDPEVKGTSSLQGHTSKDLRW